MSKTPRGDYIEFLENALEKSENALEEYNSTGLTPDQIKKIDILYKEKCEELALFKPVEGKFYYGQQLYIKRVERELTGGSDE